MSSSSGLDAWFVRLPDGRVLRAANTSVVRQQLSQGRIPLGSTVRRNPEDEWTAVEWMQEFSDILPRSQTPLSMPSASRLRERFDGRSFGDLLADDRHSSRVKRARGIRGVVDELIGALDRTLVARKLLIAAGATFLLGLLFAFVPLRPLEIVEKGSGLDRVWVALAVLVVGSIAVSWLTWLTYVELSRPRSAGWLESLWNITRLTIRVALAQLVVNGNLLLLLEVLRLLPGLFLADDPLASIAPSGVAPTLAVVSAMVAEIVQWPLLTLSMLIAPILVVEHCSLGAGLLLWAQLLRRRIGKAFIYQALAVGVGLMIATPFFVPPLVFITIYQEPRLLEAVQATRTILISLALAPLFAYLAVANVFVYMNLRLDVKAPKS